MTTFAAKESSSEAATGASLSVPGGAKRRRVLSSEEVRKQEPSGDHLTALWKLLGLEGVMN